MERIDRWLKSLVVCGLALGMASAALGEREVVDGVEWTWWVTYDNSGAVVAGANPATGDLTLPATLGNLPVKEINDEAFMYNAGLTSVTISDNVESIGECAFAGCENLEFVSLSESVADFGRGPFSGCVSLTQILVADGNPCFASSDGILYSKNWETLACFPAGIGGEFSIPEGVTDIGDDAFSGCAGLTSLTVPDSVTYVGLGAFWESGLETLYVPASWEGTDMLDDADVPEGCEVIYGLPDGPAGEPAEWYVDAGVAASGDGQSRATAFQTLEEALAAAGAGDTVWLAPGTYDGDVEALPEFNGALRGLGTAAETVIEGSPEARCLPLTGLSDLTLQNGRAGLGDGWAVWNGERPTAFFERCVIRGWTVSGGDQPLAICEEMSDCLVVGNECEWETSSALVVAERIVGCTLAGNRAPYGVFDGYTDESADEWIPCVAANSILWDNYATTDFETGEPEEHLFSYSPDEVWEWDDEAEEEIFMGYTVVNCCANPNSTVDWDDDDHVMWEQPDEREDLTVIFADPCFVDAANGDYRLASGSPCLDAGAPEWVTDGELDVAGNARVQGAAPDIGCFEGETSVAPANQQIVTFDPNGGTCSKLSAKYAWGGKYSGFKIPVRDDLKFLGWFDSLTGGTRVRIGMPVTEEPERTLFAHWEQIVRFDPNGGSCKVSSRKAVVGEPYAKLTSATREGYKFLGWYDAEGNRVKIGDSAPPEAERTLFAHWQGLPQTLRFDAGEGTCKVRSRKAVVGEPYTKLASATREGYKFLGWYDADGTRVRVGDFATPQTDRTLFAHWKKL